MILVTARERLARGAHQGAPNAGRSQGKTHPLPEADKNTCCKKPCTCPYPSAPADAASTASIQSEVKSKCKDCGRWIQLRRMLPGHWVAFEGYDRQHDCSHPPVRSSHPHETTAAAVLQSLEFPTISASALWPSVPGAPAQIPEQRPDLRTRYRTLLLRAMKEKKRVTVTYSSRGTMRVEAFVPERVNCKGVLWPLQW